MSNFSFLHQNSLRRLANIARYGESQHITTIAVYSREDQEVLVRSIVAAQTSRLGSPGKDHSENSNDLKVNGVTENVEK